MVSPGRDHQPQISACHGFGSLGPHLFRLQMNIVLRIFIAFGDLYEFIGDFRKGLDDIGIKMGAAAVITTRTNIDRRMKSLFILKCK